MAKELGWTVSAFAASICLFSFFLEEDIKDEGEDDDG